MEDEPLLCSGCQIGGRPLNEGYHRLHLQNSSMAIHFLSYLDLASNSQNIPTRPSTLCRSFFSLDILSLSKLSVNM